MTFKSLPLSVREVKATEATLERIYKAAYLGLRNDSLALAAGLLPVEYRRLKELDQMAELAEAKGRADSEMENSQHLLDAARNGDAKAALSILQHVHGWVAKQAISVEVEQRISVIDALRAAEGRVIEGVALPVSDRATLPVGARDALAQQRPAQTIESTDAKANLRA